MSHIVAGPMSDAVVVVSDDYHTLRGTDRDHLFAAAVANSRTDDLPTGTTVNELVGRLTGNQLTAKTTRAALSRLADAGLIERIDGNPDGRARGVKITDAGLAVLDVGADRLTTATDAVA